ncbi:MAG TPA: PAS domain S-box protein, partial [Candidatus Krumholzibacteriaceae bacterium]
MQKRRARTTARSRPPAGETSDLRRPRAAAPSRRTEPSGVPQQSGGTREKKEFRSITDLLPLPVFECDLEGRLTYANPRAFECYGFTQEDFERGMTMFDTLTPADGLRAMRAARTVLPGRPSHGNEYTALRKDGSTFPIAVHTSAIMRNGRKVGIRGIVVDMTDRKLIEKELKESEERFRNIVEKGTNLFYVHSPDHVFTYLSPQVEAILGYKPEEALVRWTDFASDNPVNERAFELTQRAIDTGERQPHYEAELIAKDGRRVWFEVNEAPLVRDGKTVAIIGAAQDITERKRAEDALRQRQAKLDSIFRAAPIGIGIDKNRILIEVNDRVCEMTGYSRDELVGKSSRMLYMTDQEFDYVGHEKYAQIAQKGIGLVETRLRRKDGTAIDVLLSTAPVVEGDLSGGVTFTALDITERRRAEDALRASELKYRRLVETLQEGIWAIDRDGCTSFVNPRMAEMLGHTVEEMYGKHVSSFLDERGVEDYEKYLERRRGGVREQYEVGFIHKNGEKVYVRLETSRLTDENGDYIGAIAGVQDITERKQAEDERRKLELQIQETQKLESLGILAGGIAHDFNNILTAIHGNLEFAIAALSPDSPALASLADVDRASRHAADLCKQLLAYSGKGRFAIGEVDLGKVVKEMVQILGVSISKKAVLRFDIAPDLSLIKADESQIQQVVMNLIINASEALGEEGGVISLSAGAIECNRAYLKRMILGEHLSEGRYVFLEVADTGVGMDEETQAKIFDPFFSTKFTGRGLGLAVVLGIVRG